MRTIARFMDARNTAEGKFLSVLLSMLLVFSFLNVTMFTDYAGADTNEASEENSLPVEEPEFTEPEATAEEPEAEKASEEVTTPAPPSRGEAGDLRRGGARGNRCRGRAPARRRDDRLRRR